MHELIVTDGNNAISNRDTNALDSPRIVKGRTKVKGQDIAKTAARGCHRMQTGCKCHRATSKPQACAFDIARPPAECLSRRPCALTHGRVAAQPAISMQRVGIALRVSSVTYPHMQSCQACKFDAYPRCVQNKNDACAPHKCQQCTHIVNASCVHRLKTMRPTASFDA